MKLILTMSEILDSAFPNPDLEFPDTSLVEDLLDIHIPIPGGTAMETEAEQERLRRELFGENYFEEYF